MSKKISVFVSVGSRRIRIVLKNHLIETIRGALEISEMTSEEYNDIISLVYALDSICAEELKARNEAEAISTTSD
jgi:hypothetical protein